MEGLVVVHIVFRHGCLICMLFTLIKVHLNANKKATHPLKSPFREQVEIERCMLLEHREVSA